MKRTNFASAKRKKAADAVSGAFFVAPLCIGLCLFLAFPLCYAIGISFTDYQMNAPEQHQWVIQAKKQMQEYFQRIAEQGRLENQVDPALSKEVCCDILQSALIGFAVACHARHMNEAGLDRLSASVSEGLHRALAPRH